MVIGNSLCHQRPKSFGMIEFAEMAEFMDDHIIGKVFGKMRDPIMKVEISLFGTAPPPRTLIADRDLAVGETVMPI